MKLSDFKGATLKDFHISGSEWKDILFGNTYETTGKITNIGDQVMADRDNYEGVPSYIIAGVILIIFFSVRYLAKPKKYNNNENID